jgi:chemotaxis protein methyltransferase WspC
MLHAGAPHGSFFIEAVDVSRRALEFAQNAVFNPRSFRGDFPWDHEPFFESTESEGMLRLNADVKAFVRFRQANIIAPDFLNDDAPYDVVFCRNLMIYLHAEARLHAMSALRRLVVDEGILVVGHAEAAFAREHGFKPVGPSGAFAFSKSTVAVRAVRQPKMQHVQPAVPMTVVQNVPATTIPDAGSVIGPLEAVPGDAAESLLVAANHLADAGRLHEALRLCSEHLQKVPDSVEGYFLLGILHDALGHLDTATKSFRKVLYLDPCHQEALLCLALKQEARGDTAGAALLRARAQRQAGAKP